MHILTTVYPGHPWAVRVDQGIIFIRHLLFGANWGMNIKTKDVEHDSAVLRKKVVMYAGEWLGRAGLKRGRADGTEIARVEGRPGKYQPNQPLEARVVIQKQEERTKPWRTG